MNGYNKETNIIDFYMACNNNKNILVDDYSLCEDGKRRQKSVAESLFESQMMALALFSQSDGEYNTADISNILLMIALNHLNSSDFYKLEIGSKLQALHNEYELNYYKEARLANLCVNNKAEVLKAYSNNSRFTDFMKYISKLSTIQRKGWLDWNVQVDRKESDSDHIYGTQMLALAMYFENYEEYKDLDIKKILLMLAIHELGEAIIGDLTAKDIKKEDKQVIEHEAFKTIISNLDLADDLFNLYLEFDNKTSPEARFAKFIDKFECDLQSKVLDETAYVDIEHQEGNKFAKDDLVVSLLKKYEGDRFAWSKMWLEFGQITYGYDKQFMDVSNYAMNHNLVKNNSRKAI